MLFPTRIAGIPCQCHVLHYRPPVPTRILHDGSVLQGLPSEFLFVLRDVKGYRAPWLEAKMKPQDIERLQEEYRAYESDLSDT